MSNPLLGYLGSALIFAASILMFAAQRPVAGGLLVVVSIAGAILKYRMQRKNK